MLSFVSLLLLGAAGVAEAAPAYNSSADMSVKTTSGTIIGHASSQYADVTEYLGIPFAQPPLGAQRFMPPQAYNGSGTVVADSQPLSCPQAPATVNSSLPTNWQNLAAEKAIFANHTSEDCLYLNVWTAGSCAEGGEAGKPVMVWLYGGGFHSGGVADASEQGGIFAHEQDVVAVSINYRLGVFGFPGGPGLTQNVGLLDQRLAVEWVRDNIARFGGDPARITIYGHSAGSTSVDFYNYAWRDDPIVAGSIVMSGAATSFGVRYQNTTGAAWSSMAAMLNCTGAAAADVAACVRGKPADAVLQASLAASKAVEATLDPEAKLYAGITGVFGPTIDHQTVFENYTARAAQGLFARRPVLTGSNNDEGCYFSMEGQVPVAADGLLTAGVFTCPISRVASFRAAQGVPAWKYRYFGAYPNLEAVDCPGQPWHGQELYVMFNSSARASQEPATQTEIRMGRYIRDAWSAFAHDPTNGLTSVEHWPQVAGANSSSIVLLGTNSTLERAGNADAFDGPCALLTKGAPNF